MKSEYSFSKQQQKSQLTKDKIFKAAKEILKKDGYESLSIKNICEAAGVSNGSFYHHFQSKEDLLSYYIEHQPLVQSDILTTPCSASQVIHTIIQVYLNYARYCQELGVDFIANYYTPKNEALNPKLRTERAYPIVTVEHYLNTAISIGVINPILSLESITTDIRMLIIGNVFEWCLTSGACDFASNIKRTLSIYLNQVLENKEDSN